LIHHISAVVGMPCLTQTSHFAHITKVTRCSSCNQYGVCHRYYASKDRNYLLISDPWHCLNFRHVFTLLINTYAAPLLDPALTSDDKIHDLIRTVAEEASLTKEQSDAAVASTLRYLKARLSSPVVGQLHELLYNGQTAPTSEHQRTEN